MAQAATFPSLLRWLAVAALAWAGASVAAPKAAEPHDGRDAEAQLVRSLQDIRENRLDNALARIDRIIEASPNFRLAHLIKGDLLMARARPISNLGNAPDAPADRVEDLRQEAKVRLLRYQEPIPAGRVPRYLLQMQPDQRYALIADTSRSRLFVFENVKGEPRLAADYYISSGKNGADKVKAGDKKTPVGVYFVTANLPRKRLTDFYGSGAFPISYPNEWDRRQGRNGHGIWLHGTPSDTFSRPPRASDGCVVLTNADLDALARRLQVGVTPVVITPGMEWVTPDELKRERDGLGAAVEAWRRDWESRDTDAYLRHYSRNFSSGTQDLGQWSRQKRQVNAGKDWIKVKLADVGMFLYPGAQQLAVVDFEQDYSSNNLSNHMKKRQYWVREGGRWKIVYEGGA